MGIICPTEGRGPEVRESNGFGTKCVAAKVEIIQFFSPLLVMASDFQVGRYVKLHLTLLNSKKYLIRVGRYVKLHPTLLNSKKYLIRVGR